MTINKEHNDFLLCLNREHALVLDYVVPMLGWSKAFFDEENHEVKAYLGIKGKYDDKIVLVYKGRPVKHVHLEMHKRYIETIIHNEHHIYIFEIYDKKSYDLFLEGKYSKFSGTYKKRIKSLTDEWCKHPITSELVYNPILGVLFKNKFLRSRLEEYLGVTLPDDAELRSKPDKDKLTFDLSNHKKLSLI